MNAMNGWSPEELAWEARRVGAGAAGPLPPDEMLEAYRAGGLSDLGARRLEWMLCRSAAARDRLTALAGVHPQTPPARVRENVLRGLRETPRPHRPRLGLLAAAVVLAGAMISAAILFDADPARTLPSGLAFDVRVEGLAASRSGEGRAEARPDTPVRITVEPQRDGLDGLDFAVYAQHEGQLRRLVAAEDGLRQESYRGAALLVVPAASLVGDLPGTREFFVIVAPSDTLPDRLSLEAAGSVALTREALVYRKSITVLSSER